MIASKLLPMQQYEQKEVWGSLIKRDDHISDDGHVEVAIRKGSSGPPPPATPLVPGAVSREQPINKLLASSGELHQTRARPIRGYDKTSEGSTRSAISSLIGSHTVNRAAQASGTRSCGSKPAVRLQ